MYSPNTTNLHYTNYVFNTSTSGCEIYDLDTESIIKYVTYSGGLNSVWSNEDYAYLATPDDGIYRLDLDYITSVTGMDLTSYLDVFKQYPDILDNEVKYIHGCGDYMCVVTASGVDHFNFGNSSSYTRSSGLVAAEKCFQTCRGRFYYTAGPKTVTIYTHQCDWSEGTEGYVYDSTSPGTLLPESATVRDIFVVEGTSSYGQNNNLILVATSEGAALIEERLGDEANSNYKIYLTPYVTPYVGDRGIFAAGFDSINNLNVIDYITISTTANTEDFGDISLARRLLYAASNGVDDRGVFGGGYTTASDDTIDYVTISTPANALDFGNLTAARQSPGAASNGTNNRAVWGGGYTTANVNTIDYVTVSTTSNAADFGDLTALNARRNLAATSNGANNRGVFGAGYDGSNNFNTLDYITISTTGNATDFGDLTQARRVLTATSDTTNNRGVFAGGYTTTNVDTLDYITISTTGNANDFGDLTSAIYSQAGTSNGTNERGVFGGGYNITPVNINSIDYITISTVGNAADFGDLTAVRRAHGATADA